MTPPTRFTIGFLFLVACAVVPARADDATPRPLFDPADPAAAGQVAANDKLGDTTFTVGPDGIDVTVKAGGEASYPGIVIKPTTPWDASGYGHVEATVTNRGAKPIRAHMRIDNAGRDASNVSSQLIQPGETKLVPVVFGYSNGKRAFALDPKAITAALIFTGKSDVEQSFRISAIQAAGPAGEKPEVDPRHVAVKPQGGVILGDGAAFDAATQLAPTGGAKITASSASSFDIAFTGAQSAVAIRPKSGVWNLSDHLQVRVRVRNTGSAAVSPSVQVRSRGGASDTATAASPIPPGQEGEIVASFIPVVSWRGQDLPEMSDSTAKGKGFQGQEGTGTKFTSNTTTDVLLMADKQAGEATLQVTGVIADMPPRQPLPDWLGQRPPVDGEWTLTFDDGFDGDAIDLTRWNIYTPREWHLGKATGFSKDNVIVKDGKLALRLEKRRVHHNDNPEYKTHEYATGWADTYGKWTQRYGYFEARYKLPTTPDSFIAFWLMPDRGIDFKPHEHPRYEGQELWRNNTHHGGMEFDIMEHLSIWGPNRHNFAMHWDHYNQFHKVTGSAGNYVQPDEEGFITSGMLWTPGAVVLYQNGREAARWETSRIGSLPSYMILQHITGGWETEGMDDSQLPSDLVFDYVRVWQRNDLASDLDGPKPNTGGPLPPQKK